ncbi:DUF1294 domain-containing protein [Microbacterium sp. C7(2022)]|uniref:DUF1294 domain-containing protein n=1 Tax=Microbacterium sp. C7(2022) TaxID=2992759 RepID=UPI00237A3CC4|nr:DUF1294 domain-containing protein [Microbacterium sp. C7(2022)]MDE0546715.1 DUF1294 domain-containing protein [Microbacterium sp. C7(2022)]
MPTPKSAPARPERDMSRPLPSALSWTVLIGFAAALAIAFFGVPLAWWVPAAYGALSVMGFAAYGIDKSAARRQARRISEQTLLTVGLIGGWPGALVAQQLFRHKTRKRSFRRAFWSTVVINVLVVGGVVAYVASR